MNGNLKKLLEQLELSDKSHIYQGKLKEITVDKTDNSWFFDIEFKKPLEIDQFEIFSNRMKELPNKIKSVTLCDYYITYKKSNNKILPDYYDFVLRSLSAKKPRFSSILDFDIEHNDNRIEVLCPEDGTFVKDLLYEIRAELAKLGFDARLATSVNKERPLIQDRIIKQGKDFLNETMQIVETNPTEITFVSYDKKVVRGVKDTISDIPRTDGELIEYKSANDSAFFSFEGEITKIDARRINGTTDLFTFIVSDDEDSIFVKKFVKDPIEKKFHQKTKVGMRIKVKGVAQFDKFSDEVSITANVLERTTNVVQKDYRNDLSKEKRVELHVHTKMSTLDGINSVTEYVETAKKWGHEAIAITDHGNVQSFPDFYKATKDGTIKPIYGAEFTFVDESEMQIVKNPIDIPLDEAIYTVFDIETTGLSVNNDKIIEIAAIKIQNGQILDEYTTYVNPERPISDITTKITSITSKDVALAPTIDAVIGDFYNFFKGTIMVAHNAQFDMGFIYSELKNNGIAHDVMCNICTLQFARNEYGSVLKRFNLKAVSKYFKVDLVQHHRAIYDTRATSDIFISMIRDVQKKGLKNVNELNSLSTNSDGYKHAISKHINLLVQNQSGLKNLFKIASIANTINFYRDAKLLRSVLETHREGILVGSGCMNSSFFEFAMNKSYEDTLEKARFYDFLELQPLSDFIHFEEDSDNATDNIKRTFERIISIGNELDIPVVATGDVHHILENDKKFRDIYVQTPVVGGGRHPLARYSEIPSQYLRTTKEMLEEFEFLGAEKAKEIVITNSVKVARSIDHVKAFKNELYAPTDDFLASKGIPSIENKLIKMVADRAKEIYGTTVPQIVGDRIDKEIKSITENKFSTVYYISHLLVKKSLDEGYLVGSRGSVGSSLVATLMDITEVNPMPPHYVCPSCHFSSFKMTSEQKIKYGIKEEEMRLQTVLAKVESGFDLPNESCPHCNTKMNKDGHAIPFETFLGFKGDKVPDIDLNFSGDYQPVVHDYIREIFGDDRTFRAGTISTVAEKTAFGYVKGFLEKKQITMRKAEIERRASKITGVKRSTGQHPGGIVVVPGYKDIYDVTPIQFPADDTSSSWRTTHFDYHSFEDNLFKLDVLGHDDPTMIRYLMDYVKAHPDEFDFTEATQIPIADPNVFRLLSSTDVIGLTPEDLDGSKVASFGIPEMGTKFVRDMLTDSRPKTFADIVKISGLSHGTDVWINNAKTLVTGTNSKFGKIPFSQVIGCRDDIMVYLINNGLKNDVAFEIAEFIRKGKPTKMVTEWEGYKLIMRENNIPPWYIWSCGKIKYMFPKAHATAYVMMAMRIAWFKLYKPLAFYSAYFSKRASDFDVYAFKGGKYTIGKRMDEIREKGKQAKETEKRLYTVLEIALEMTLRGFDFKPVDINESSARNFEIDDDNKSLRMPFMTIDGLGYKVAKSIVVAREESAFKSKDDVMSRTNVSKSLSTKFEMLDAYGDLPDNSQMKLF